MLNSRGHALSQGDGSDFHIGGNWEAATPGYSACVRAWSKVGTTLLWRKREGSMWLWGSLCHAA